MYDSFMWNGTNDSNLLFETWIKWKIYHDIVICIYRSRVDLPYHTLQRRSLCGKKINKSVSIFVWSHAFSLLYSLAVHIWPQHCTLHKLFFLLRTKRHSSFSKFITSSLIFYNLSLNWVFVFSSVFSFSFILFDLRSSFLLV